MLEQISYYQVLELASNASAAQIKSSYRRLARRYHPDLNGDDQVARDKFEQVAQAYRVLSDPNLRSQYDQQLKHGSFDSFQPGRSPQARYTRLYEQGIISLQEGNNFQAIKTFSQALEHHLEFAEAYHKRGIAYYRIGNAAAAVKDLNRAIELKPEFKEAYYNRGLARFRLGYGQSAIADFDQAIELNPNYGQAYYRRGLTYRDLGDEAAAQIDLQAAIAAFDQIGDVAGSQLAKEAWLAGGGKAISMSLPKINLDQVKLKLSIPLLPDLFKPIRSTCLALRLFALNPLGGLLPAYVKIGNQAIAVALVLTVIFDLCLVGGVYLLWWQHFGYATAPIGRIAFSGVALVSSLAVASFFLRAILGRKTKTGSFVSDLFTAAAAVIPISVVAIAAGIYTFERAIVILVIAIICSCYSILTIYSGCSQIASLNETRATLATALLLAIAGMLILACVGWIMPDVIPAEGIV
jgi:curved DNA-binding protein CbpA